MYGLLTFGIKPYGLMVSGERESQQYQQFQQQKGSIVLKVLVMVYIQINQQATELIQLNRLAAV